MAFPACSPPERHAVELSLGYQHVLPRLTSSDAPNWVHDEDHATVVEESQSISDGSRQRRTRFNFTLMVAGVACFQGDYHTQRMSPCSADYAGITSAQQRKPADLESIRDNCDNLNGLEFNTSSRIQGMHRNLREKEGRYLRKTQPRCRGTMKSGSAYTVRFCMYHGPDSRGRNQVSRQKPRGQTRWESMTRWSR